MTPTVSRRVPVLLATALVTLCIGAGMGTATIIERV